jgi:hypothetical protein
MRTEIPIMATAASSSQPNKTPSVVATLATSGAMTDLQTLLFSLALFNDPAPKVYLYCDSQTKAELPNMGYSGKIIAQTALDRYTGKTRQQMEAVAGREFASEWFDFMAEKINLLDWVFREEGANIDGSLCCEGNADNGTGVLFCDADICFLASLPSVPDRATLALSPHFIRPYDESRFGRYNGGFFWLSNPTHLEVWRKACVNSRFYEQSALEDVATALTASAPKKFCEFPKQHNYGWWRLWQCTEGYQVAQAEWSMNRRVDPKAAGITVGGGLLGSVHTHFWETKDSATIEYNKWVKGWLQKLASAGHQPARRLLHWLNGPGSLKGKSKAE